MGFSKKEILPAFPEPVSPIPKAQCIREQTTFFEELDVGSERRERSSRKGDCGFKKGDCGSIREACHPRREHSTLGPAVGALAPKDKFLLVKGTCCMFLN